MVKQYIGITGFTTRSEVDTLLAGFEADDERLLMVVDEAVPAAPARPDQATSRTPNTAAACLQSPQSGGKVTVGFMAVSCNNC